MFEIKKNEKRKKESSLILRKAKFQAIFKFVLSSASGGAGGGKYNRISAFVSMSVLLIGRSLEKFFKKNFRDDLSFLTPVASIIALALLLFLATTTESWAENPSGTCGTNCNWVLDGDTLKITGGSNGEIGTMTGYGYKTINGVYDIYDSSDKSRPWIEYQDQIKKVDIQGVANVGSLAFSGFEKVTDISMGDTIKTIGQYAFSSTNAQTIVLPDSITKVDIRAFSKGNATLPTSLKQLVIPDSVNFIGNSAFGANNEQLQNLEIICKGDQAKCVSTLSKYEYYDNNGGTVKYIPMNLASHMSVADYNYCASTNFYWNGVNCIREPDLSKRRCCSDVCKDMGGWCNRIRYTPAEAAEVLHDDNTNEVTITFKK